MSQKELFEVKIKHSDLIPIAYKWVLKNGSCGCAFKELNSIVMKTPSAK
jgi:hypothetical protein